MDLHTLKLYQPSKHTPSAPMKGLPFSDYLLITQKLLETVWAQRCDNYEHIIHAIGPKENIPPKEYINPSTGKYKTGVLLIHGLLDTPFSLLNLFEHFKEKNCLVRSILLPGHGTVPGDLLDITSETFIKTTQYAIDSFKEDVENVYIAGHSTGGNLALLATKTNPQLKGLILLAPAIKMKLLLARFCHIPPKFSSLLSPLNWVIKTLETDYGKYQSIAFNGVHQVYRLSKSILESKKPPWTDVPIHMVLTEDDEVVCPKASKALFNKNTHKDSRLILYGNDPIRQDDVRISMRPSANLEKRIINFSHQCLALSPEHPHYGALGDYSDFKHYRKVMGRLLKKNINKPLYEGAISWNNLYHYRLKRLTYNPDFKNLMTSIDGFIDKTQA